ncbi:MAG TPA: penicillin-binding protein 2 [Candidatus Saccharimonadales bacterium]|nr:penicillin-binding protein 2 [Candidatus Saccharimonadales bacterium]
MAGPLFGYGGEDRPRKGRPTIKRDQGGHESWADAILPADAEAGTIETPTSRRSLYILVAAILVVAGLLVAQLVQLQVVQGQRNLGLAEGNRLRQKITRAPRGLIYDRHKKVLAQNLASFDITVIPSLLPKDEATRQQLYVKVGNLIGKPAAEIAAKSETDCVTAQLARKLTQTQSQRECLSRVQPQLVAPNLERETALGFDQATTTVPGFSLDVNPIRQYGEDIGLSAILGYTGRASQQDLQNDRTYLPTDYVGKLGIEAYYEQVLRGQNGTEQTEVDASGRPVKVLASTPASAGSDIVLSIDSDLQKTLRDAITRQMQAAGSKRASGIAINPNTGEVLAAVNAPSYDNNLFAGGISQKDYTKLVSDPGQPLFNKVMAGAFPTGSIIKPLIGSAALQEHVVSQDTTVNDTGSIVVTNKYDPNVKYTYRSYEPGGLGVVNIFKAIAVSSDVYFFTVGGGYGNIAGLGVNRLASYYQKFGLGRKPGIDIAEQTAGRVPTPEWKKKLSGESWTLGDTYNISIGQGDLLASPLQMAVAESAVANGGKVVKPHLLREVHDSLGRTTQTVKPEVLGQGFISPYNLDIIRSGMRQVVSASYGTACCFIEKQVPVAVAAKTGTAETDPTGNRKPHAWFTAFAPYDNPQIEIVVLIENSGEGAQFAAPAVRETLAWCFSRPGGCVQ